MSGGQDLNFTTLPYTSELPARSDAINIGTIPQFGDAGRGTRIIKPVVQKVIRSPMQPNQVVNKPRPSKYVTKK